MYGTETQSDLSEPCNLGTFQNIVWDILRQRCYLVNPLIGKGYSNCSKHSNSISPHTKWGCASTQTLTAHFIHSQLVNNPQAGDALEYAPPLKKKCRIVFCACMYDTRKKQIRSTYTMYKETLKNTRWLGKNAPFSPFSKHTLGCFYLWQPRSQVLSYSLHRDG